MVLLRPSLRGETVKKKIVICKCGGERERSQRAGDRNEEERGEINGADKRFVGVFFS